MYAQMNSSPRAHVFKPSVHGSHPFFGHACVILCLWMCNNELSCTFSPCTFADAAICFAIAVWEFLSASISRACFAIRGQWSNAAEKIQVALASFLSGDTALSANSPWILHLGCCYIQGSQRSKPLKLSQCCPRLRSTHRTSRKSLILWGYTHKRSWIFTDVFIVVICNNLTGTVEWCFVGIPRFSIVGCTVEPRSTW